MNKKNRHLHQNQHQHQNQSATSSSIPIPSFSLQAVPIPMDNCNNTPTATAINDEAIPEAIGIPLESSDSNSNDDNNNNNNNINNISNNERIKLPIKSQWILRLESALQLQLTQTKAKQITYKEFCKLVPKLVLDQDKSTTTTTTTTTATDDSVGKNDPSSLQVFSTLSTEERLWHDLYCVGIPSLFKLVHSSSSSTENKNKNKNKNNSQPTNATTTTTATSPTSTSASTISATNISLELVPVAGNRFKEVRELLKDATSNGIWKKQSDEAIQILLALRNNNNSSSNNSNNKSQKTESDSNSTAVKTLSEPLTATATATAVAIENSDTTKQGTTLEDRVRAKAQLREQHLQEVHEIKNGPNIEERLALADALFSHARGIMRRRKQLQAMAGPMVRLDGSVTTNATTKCVLTFQDLCAVLSSSKLFSTSTVSSSSSLSTSSKSYITKILTGIVETCPGWITWTDPKHGENGVPISKDATVWIETADYKRIRTKLQANKSNHDAGGGSVNGTKMQTETSNEQQQQQQQATKTTTPQKSNVTVSGAKRKVENDNNNDSENSHLKQQKSLKSLMASAARTANIVKHANSTTTAAGTSSASSNFSVSSTKMGNITKASKKRPAQDDSDDDGQGMNTESSSSTTITSNPVAKKARTEKLRVNPNFILCDADYDGGGIIQPSLELPRGLRALFLRVNAGERI